VEIIKGNAVPAYRARVYACYIDETDARGVNWRPESYADAEGGLIRHRSTHEVRSHGLVGFQSEDDNIYITLTSSPVVLVAVDPVNRFYAYRVFRYEMPLDRIYVPVVFKVWQWEQPYREGEWTVVSAQSEEEEL
jgi:hypothetical protein